MNKKWILDADWRSIGSLAPFRDLARQLQSHEIMPTGYESLLDLLLHNKHSSSSFVPPAGDVGTPNHEFSWRLADGVVNLIISLVRQDHALHLDAVQSLDPWTEYCVSRLRQVGTFHAVDVSYHSRSSKDHEFAQDVIHDEVQSALRFGFSWDIPHILLRSPRVRQSDEAFAHFYLGQTAIAYGKWRTALHHLSHAIASGKPEQRVSSKIALVNAYVRLDRNSSEARRLLEDLPSDIEAVSDPVAKTRFLTWLPNLHAFRLLQAGEATDQARMLLDEAITLADIHHLPLHKAVLLRNQFALIKSEHPEKALNLLETAISLRPHDQDWYCEMGYLQLSQRNPNKSRQWFNRVSTPGLPHPDRYAGLAECDFQEGDFTHSREMLNEALMLRPDRQDYLLDLGRSYQSEGKWEESLEPLWRAWTSAAFHDNAGIVLLQALLENSVSGQTARIANILSARQIPPAAELSLLLGAYYLQEGLATEAHPYFNTAIESGDADLAAVSFFYRGQLFESLGRLREAANDYEASLQLSPDLEEVQAARNELLHALGGF